jgi:outer membrane protein assembly factor BamB
MRKALLALLVTLIGLLLSATAFAQDDPVASGLNNPRHLFIGSDGTLYIAEAGSGGDMAAQGPFGDVTAGLTAQLTAVSPDGEQSVAVPELVSMNAGFGQIEGLMSSYVTDSSIWLVLGMGTQEPLVEGANVEAVVELDRETLDVLQVIDLRAAEVEGNPDEQEEIVANPADIAVSEDGTLYIPDASANALYSWTADGGLSLFASWVPEAGESQSVPDSVAIGADGTIYVGFLSGFPFAPGTARIEAYSADGELVETYEGLTLVTDVLVGTDGTLYAVELASGFGDTGYIADSGRVISVSADGVEVVAEGLNYPYGLAQDADGNLYVTINSAFVEPDSGAVIMLPMTGM